MAGVHVDLEQHRPVAGRAAPDLGRPLGWLPVGHARVRQAAGGQDRRIGQGRHIVVGAVGGDVVIGRRVLQRIAPLGPLRRGQRQVGVAHGVEHVDERHRRDDPSPQVGPHVGRRAHQHAAGRAAVGHDAAGLAVAFLDQVLGAGDEVGEGILLLVLAAVEEPAPALLRAAADVGGGPDPAAVDQRQVADRERGLHGRAV